MRRKLCLIWLFTANLSATGLSVNAQANGQWLSMPALSAGAYAQAFTDVFSCHHNKAALAFMQESSAGIMMERRFMLAELSNYGFALAVPRAWGAAGLQSRFQGGGNWSAYAVNLAYAKKLTAGMALGLQVNLVNERAAGYMPSRLLSADLSLLMRPSENWSIGLDIQHLVSATSTSDKTNPKSAIYTIGTGFSANPQTMLAAWVRHESGKPVQVAAEARYRFADRLMASIGFSSDNGSFFAGVQLSWSAYRLFVSGSKHPLLGYTPGLALQYSFKKQ